MIDLLHRSIEGLPVLVPYHIWRIAGEYANYSIVDVESNDELHQGVSALPLFAYLTIEVMPLAKHPSDVKATCRLRW